MTNYKDYIGKTFKGFKFEHKKHSNLPYDDIMNDFIGKDLKIKYYDKEYNCFTANTDYSYPADLVIAQLEKQTFKPKRGDKVLVWDDEEQNAIECIFLTEIAGSFSPYICVSYDEKEDFINGNVFDIDVWKNIKPLPEKEIAKDTLVWCKNNENNLWQQRFYSDFSDGRHYCFVDQKKSNETKETAGWNIVTTENPFK